MRRARDLLETGAAPVPLLRNDPHRSIRTTILAVARRPDTSALDKDDRAETVAGATGAARQANRHAKPNHGAFRRRDDADDRDHRLALRAHDGRLAAIERAIVDYRAARPGDGLQVDL